MAAWIEFSSSDFPLILLFKNFISWNPLESVELELKPEFEELDDEDKAEDLTLDVLLMAPENDFLWHFVWICPDGIFLEVLESCNAHFLAFEIDPS